MSATREGKLVAAALRDIARQGRSFAYMLVKCQVHCTPLVGTSLFENKSQQNSYKIHLSLNFVLSYNDCSNICPKRKSFMVLVIDSFGL